MASRYWVGGTGTWDSSNTTNWSATSGGAGGASVPTGSDDVFFDANSGSGVVTLGTATVKTIDLRGFAGSFSSSGGIRLGSGNSYLSSTVSGLQSMTFSGVATVLYGEGATVKNLVSNVTVASNITTTFLGYDSTVFYEYPGITVNAGVTVTTGYIYIPSVFSGGFAGDGKIRVTGAAGQTMFRLSNNGSIYSSFTLDCVFEFVGVASEEVISYSTGTYLTTTARSEFRFVKPGTVYAFQNTGGPTPTALPVLHAIPESAGYVQLKHKTAGSSYPIIPTMGIKSTAGPDGQQNLFGDPYSGVYSVTTTVASTSCNNMNFANIAVTGQPVSGTRIGNFGFNSGITFPAPITYYRISAGNFTSTTGWATSSGGSSIGYAPLPQDEAVFDTNTPVGTISIDLGFASTYTYTSGITATNYSGTISFPNSRTYTVATKFYFGPSTVVSMGGASGVLYCVGSGATQIQSPTSSLRCNGSSFSLDGPSVVDLTVSGTVDTNNYAHTMRLTLGSAATANFGSSAITFTGSGLVVPASATLNAGSATFTTSGATAISLDGKTLPNLTVSSATSFTTNATITSLTHSAGNISVTAAVTLTATAYTSPAPSATPPSLKCTTVGSTFTFNTSGAKVLQNLNLQGVDVPGTTYWNALNCINGGYNDAYILFNNNAGAIALF